ncbi:MAG TPA: ribosome-associated translation inhibitor RaiA [Myxococcales bacterium]|nr:ribosome-associated translation inhibitor RaiA [Myxococcales bacterium]
MQIEIRGRKVHVGEKLRAYVERRLRFSLGRFEQKVARATVHLEDVNGPKGGEDKVCRIEVRLRPGGKVFVEERASGTFAAIAGAAGRISRAISKAFDRKRSRSRRLSPEMS